MRWSGLVILCLCFVWNEAARERDSDGILREHVALGIRPWNTSPRDMRSVGYPSPAPFLLDQSWRYVAFSEDSLPKAIKIVCTDVNIPKIGNKCEDITLTLVDGSSEKTWCGLVRPFTHISRTSDITLKFKTGGNGGGRVSCTAEAIYLDENNNEKTTTTPPPPPKRDAYRTLVSEEIDSTEHGGEAGKRSTNCKCGWTNKQFSRIVNGTETGRNEFPFAAALIERRSRWRFCGSTIISEYHAITAAHCTERPVRENIKLSIIVGVHNLYEKMESPAEIIDVERIVQHQEYKGSSDGWKNDLTLLVLKSKITFSQYVGPACLPTHHQDLSRTYIKIIGWGGLYWEGPQSDYLRKVNVRVITMDECNYEYGSVNKDKPTQICTFAKRGASCQGDSGGPVIWLDPETNRYTLVGAVSFGRMCGRGPTVHTSIGHYLNWIEHYVKVSTGSQLCHKV